VDVFQDHLSRARATGGAFAKSSACPPWGLRLAGTIQLAIHAVVKGSAWLWLDDADSAVELRPGAVALVRGGPDHHIAHEPAAPCDDHDSFGEQHASDDPDDPRTSVFLCGAYQFVGDVTPALIESLHRSSSWRRRPGMRCTTRSRRFPTNWVPTPPVSRSSSTGSLT